MFPVTPRNLLKRKRRQRSVIDVIRTFAEPHHPDILCLQEVDCYEKYYYGELRNLGYGLAYKQRTGRNIIKEDGSVVAFKTNRFELIETNHLEFNDLADNQALLYEGDYLVRESIASVCVLRDKQEDKLMVVVSVHIYWNPKCVDIKILQATNLLHRVNEVAAKHGGVQAVVVGGDFNSTPDSAVFELLTTGKLNRVHEHCKNLSPAAIEYVEARLAECTTVPLLTSVYHVEHEKTEAISTMTDKWHGLIDHIMYRRLDDDDDDDERSEYTQSDAMVATLSLPTVKECKEAKIRGFPADECPSDHLPVAAILNLVGDATSK